MFNMKVLGYIGLFLTAVSFLFGSNDSLYVENIYNKADSLSRKAKNHQEAIQTYMQGIQKAKSINNNHLIASGYLNAGIACRNVSEFKQALSLLFEGYKFVENSGHILESAFLNNIGVVYRRLDDNSTALHYHLLALNKAEATHDKKNIAVALNSIGNINAFNKDYDKAIEYFEKAINIENSKSNKLGIAINLNNLGEVYEAQKDYSKALNYYEKSLNLNQELANKKGIAINLNCIGRIYSNQGNYSAALQNYEQALEINKMLGDKIYTLSSYNHNAELLIKLQRFAEAENMLDSAIQLANSLGALMELSNSYKYKSIIKENAANFKEAHKYIVLSHKCQDSAMNETISNQIAQMRTRFEIRKEIEDKEAEIKKLEIKNEIQSKTQWFLIILSALIVLAAIMIYLRYRDKSKLNKILNEKNVKIEEANHELELLNEELTQKNIEITRNQEVLSHLNEELTIANNSKDKLFSIISHDIKNPLSHISGVTLQLFDSIEHQDLNKAKYNVDELNESAKQLSLLVENLLGWAQSQKQSISYNPDDFNLKELCSEVINLVKFSASKKRIKITDKVNSNVGIYADKNMINTVIRNLLTNSIKFTPACGEIIIDAKSIDSVVEIKVIDNGIGMSKEIVDRLFSSGKTTLGTSNEKGTGLGLMLVKEFVNKNAGSIRVESAIGDGSTFIITLPLGKSSNYEPIETEEINDSIAICDIEKAKLIFDSLKNLFEKANKSHQLNIIKQFSEELIKLSNECNEIGLNKLGLKLRIKVDEFDFEEINTLMAVYSSLSTQ